MGFNFKLINPRNELYTIEEQILTNRGIPYELVSFYLDRDNFDDIAEPETLGEELLEKAAKAIGECIERGGRTLVVVDCDVDGYTSSALLVNYLNRVAPTWAKDNLSYYHHTSKQHGLGDCIDEALKYDLVICPDSASSDINEHKKLYDAGIPLIVLDHHLTDIGQNTLNYPYAIIINSQCNGYKNKDLSGVGVVWQFCRYCDKRMNRNYADDYLDLAAVGLVGDMMDLKSMETKELVQLGLGRIHNPFLVGMCEKNAFSMKGEVNPFTVTFYIVPFVNAITRSGTQEEKELIFDSMLESKANNKVLSTKRGHKLGEQETILTQALRVVTNVKKRQTDAQDASVEYLERIIAQKGLAAHKTLIITLENNNKVEPEVRGLIANKLMAKYCRPCCILTLRDGIYEGSARGYEKGTVKDFKNICEQTGLIEYAQGHMSAFGLGVAKENLAKFIETLDDILVDFTPDSSYFVDFIYENKDIPGKDILTIASMNDLWGQGVAEPYIAITHLKLTKDMITLMSPGVHPTLKFSVNKIGIIKFKASQEEYEQLIADGYVELNIIGRCAKNEWHGRIAPQILVTDYEIISKSDYDF